MKNTVRKTVTRNVLFGVLLSCMAALCILAAACDPGKTTSGGGSGQTYDAVEVMSFNIRTLANDPGERHWSSRGPHVIEYIEEKGADIVCLQEVRSSQYEDIAEGLDGVYEIVYYAREGGSDPEGLAICYRPDYRLVSKDMFWLSETPDEMSLGWGARYYRICVNVLLETPEGAYLNVFNVHLDHEVEEARVNGLDLIISAAGEAGYPTLLAGDFNTDERSGCYTEVANVYDDCAKVAPETDSGVTYQNWGEITSGTAIDFCFVSKDICTNRFGILRDAISEGVYYSDHYAIAAEIEVPCVTADSIA